MSVRIGRDVRQGRRAAIRIVDIVVLDVCLVLIWERFEDELMFHHDYVFYHVTVSF